MPWDDEKDEVISGSNITDNRLVKGDGGAKGIQETGITVNDSNDIGVNITSPTVGLDLLKETNYRQMRLSNSDITAIKRIAIMTQAYDITEEDNLLIGIFADTTTSVVQIGGGLGASGDFNSATEIQFHTAPNNTTTNTTAAVVINDDGNLGLNASSPSERLTMVGNARIIGQIATPLPSTLIPAGTTQDIDWDNGNFQVLDLGVASGNVTLTFSNANSGAFLRLGIIQGSTARTITWPASVKGPGGVIITLSTGNDDIDFVGFEFDGSTFYTTFAKNDFT